MEADWRPCLLAWRVAFAQIKKVAEAAVAELKARLKERDGALEALQANMLEEKVGCTCASCGHTCTAARAH